MVAKRHRSASRRRHPGPFSRDQAITDVDRRTREGRFLKTVTTELINHLGDATAPQRLLVQAAALKATRMMLLTDQLLAGVPLSEGSDHHALAWLNSMRPDLMAIGLERKGPASIDLREYLRSQTEVSVTEATTAEMVAEVVPEAMAAE
jgi:hypothetical protein